MTWFLQTEFAFWCFVWFMRCLDVIGPIVGWSGL